MANAVDPTEVKNYLGIKTENYNGELEGFISAAEAVISHRVGPLQPTQITETVAPLGSSLLLRVRPVISVTSVTAASGGLVTNTTLDSDAGLITGSGLASGQSYTVVYMAGRATLPEDLKKAVSELVRHMWQTQRGTGVRPGTPPSETASNTLPGAAYLLPFRVESLLVPYESVSVAFG